jgi:replicative DNA helicase
VLSCLLLDNEVLYLIEGVALEPVDFYQKEHQLIFDAVRELWHARKTIDVITLSNQLTKGDHLDVV